MIAGVMKTKLLKLRNLTRLKYTGLIGELEHLKIKTRLIDEKFASVMVCVLEVIDDPSRWKSEKSMS
jgi:hypothetical protein